MEKISKYIYKKFVKVKISFTQQGCYDSSEQGNGGIQN